MPAAILAFVAFLLLLSAGWNLRKPFPRGPFRRNDRPALPLERVPKSLDYSHSGWRVSEGGEATTPGSPFEPQGGHGAPLAIVTHGYGEFSGYDRLYELIRTRSSGATS